jgi:hypothetical protein
VARSSFKPPVCQPTLTAFMGIELTKYSYHGTLLQVPSLDDTDAEEGSLLHLSLVLLPQRLTNHLPYHPCLKPRLHQQSPLLRNLIPPTPPLPALPHLRQLQRRLQLN